MADKDLILTQNDGVGIEYVSKIVNMQKGALLSADAVKLPTVLEPGTNGYILTRDDAAADGTGLSWKLASDVLSTPITVLLGGTGLAAITNDCFVIGKDASEVEVVTKMKWESDTLRLYDGTTRLTMVPGASVASIYNYDSGYKDLVLGGSASNSGIYIDKTNDRVGIFQGIPLHTFDVAGSFRSTGATYIEDIKTASGTSFVSVDSTGRLGTEESPSHSVEYYWVGATQVLNHTTAPGMIHRYTITNTDYDAGVSSVTWKWTVDGYRALDSSVGHGSFDVYLKFSSGVSIYSITVDADNQEEYFSIELLISPIDTDYSIVTMKVFLGGDKRSVTSRIGRESTTNNNKTFHGTVDNLELWFEDDEADSQVWKNRIIIEKLIG